jgi:hypothetical protein
MIPSILIVIFADKVWQADHFEAKKEKNVTKIES